MFSMLSVLAAAELIASTSPLPTVPVRCSVPPPEAVIVSAAPVPDRVRLPATVPMPVIAPFPDPEPREMPALSVNVDEAPSSLTVLAPELSLGVGMTRSQ